MKIIAIDDEQIALDGLALKLGLLGDDDLSVRYFTDVEEALASMREDPADLAFLDINMPSITGLDLADAIKQAHPGCLISFLTGYEEYALDAFRLHVFDYLTKPVSVSDLRKTVADAKEHLRVMAAAAAADNAADQLAIEIRTFGQFDVFVNGRILPFHHKKSKELLAYLVDKRGGSVTPSEGCLLFWPDSLADRAKQSQYQTIVRNLVNCLEEGGASDILIRERGSLSIDTRTFECDLYRFLEGDEDAYNSFLGEYMTAYSWAEDTLGELLNR